MIGRNSQEGEIFAMSKLDKIYVNITPLSDMNLMVESKFLYEQQICRGPGGGNL